MIRVDLLVFVVVLVLAVPVAAVAGAWVWGRAIKRDALRNKEWLLANTVFKATLMADLRALEIDAQGVLAMVERADRRGENFNYWSGKLQAFRDVIVKLRGKVYGKI